MGQRSQTFIKINNPLKNKEYKKELCESDLSSARKIFGNAKHSVIPFYHQWLFGLTFAGMSFNILSEVRKAKGKFHPFSKDYSKTSYAKRTDRIFGNTQAYGTIDIITDLISMQSNTEIAEKTNRFGHEAFSYIGDECYNEKGVKESKWGDIRADFTIEDNNDGVLIIDAVEMKYGFYRDVYEKNILFQEPVSAKEYVRKYYPTSQSELSDYAIKQAEKGKGVEQLLSDNLETIIFTKDLLQYFQVLSLKEVKTIFPKMYKEKKVAVK